MRNIVDSSGWLEYFMDGENAEYFASVIEDGENLLVPVICLYEVFKRLALLNDIDTAQTLISDMLTGRVVEIDQVIALDAAQLALEYKLAMADSLILASSRLHTATLWTQDEHFKEIPGVSFISKESKPEKTKKDPL